MEADEEFLHKYFTLVSQLYFDKAKEHIDKEKDTHRIFEVPNSTWTAFLNQLLQLALAEKNYIEIGFLHNKNKGFLRKDNSLRAIYETIKFDLKRIEETSRLPQEKRITIYCQNIAEFITARIFLIDYYSKIYFASVTKVFKNAELLQSIEILIEKTALGFTEACLTPIKAVFSIECAILEQLFKALVELQRLEFLSSLAYIHGAHTRLHAWENNKLNREVVVLGFIRKNQLPALIQWCWNFKGAVLSKFSLFFHNTLSEQTTVAEMNKQCAKLQYDHYNKMMQFQKRYDASAIILLSDALSSSEIAKSDISPVIVSYPHRLPFQIDQVLNLVTDTSTNDLLKMNCDKIIYKYNSQEKFMCVFAGVEPGVYLVITFDAKKTEKDVLISNFILEMCSNLRCFKVFDSLKVQCK